MSFELIERDMTRNRLTEILGALENSPSSADYMLDEFTLRDLLNMADVADYDVKLQFRPRNTKKSVDWAV